MKRNRTARSALNMAIGMCSQAMTLVLSFVSRTVFIHFLSSEYLGINGLLSNVLTMLSFAELGIGEAMTYAMYKPAKEDDHEMMSQLMLVYKKAYTIIGIAVGAIGVILSFFMQFLIAEPPNIPESLQTIFLFYIVNNTFSYFLTYKKSVLIAYQENYIISIISQILGITQQIIQIIVLYITQKFYFYLGVQVVFTLANNIAIAIVVGKRYPWLEKKSEKKLPHQTAESIAKNVKSLAVSKIAGVISNGADNIIISKLLGLVSVGLVSNYTLIINSLNSILWNGMSNMTSSFGNFNVDSELQRKRSIFDELFLCAYWIYSFLSVGVVVLINPFIKLWLGENYLISNSVVIALVLIVYVGGVNYPVYTYQTTLGMYDKLKYPYLMSGVLNIILSVFLGKRYGLFGIYIATSVSRLCTSEIAGGFYVYRDGLKLPPIKYYQKYVGAFFLLILNLIITNWITSKICIEGFWGFLIKLIVCICVCNGLIFIVLRNSAECKSLMKRVYGLIKND